MCTDPADQQLGHRARVGRAVSARTTAARRRVEAAVTGEFDERELTGEERVVFNAELDASISEATLAIGFGEVLATRGETTVALDEHGRLTRYHPDGSTNPLEWPAASGGCPRPTASRRARLRRRG